MAMNFALMFLSLIVLANLLPHHANARLLAEKAQETTPKQVDEKTTTTSQSNGNFDQTSDPKNLGDVKTIPPFTAIPGIPFPSIPGGIPFPTVPGGIPFPTNPGGLPFPTIPGGLPFPTIPGGLPFPTIPGGLPFPTPLPDIPVFNNPFDNVIPGVPIPPFSTNPFSFLSPPPA